MIIFDALDAVSLTHGPLILPEDLPEEIRRAEPTPAIPVLQHEREHITLDELEKRYLIKVLKDTGNNKVRAAKILGIDRRTLYRMAERFGIELGEEGENPS